MAAAAGSLVGVDLVGGGIITGPGSTLLRVLGVPLAQVGDAVADHGSGGHDAAVIVEGTSLLRTAGVPVCVAGAAASCGHVASGSATLLRAAFP